LIVSLAGEVEVSLPVRPGCRHAALGAVAVVATTAGGRRRLLLLVLDLLDHLLEATRTSFCIFWVCLPPRLSRAALDVVHLAAIQPRSFSCR